MNEAHPSIPDDPIDPAVLRDRNLQRIFNNLIVGVVQINIEGHIIYANAAAARILHLERDKIVERYFNQTEWRQIDEDGNPYPPEKLPLAIAMVEKREVRLIEHGIIDDKGNITWLEVNASPLIDEQGNLTGAIASFADVTAKKEEERARRKAQEQLDQIAAAVPGTMFQMSSMGGRFIEYNFISEGARETLGLSPQEIIQNRTHFLDKIISADRQFFLTTEQLSFETMTPLKIEFRYGDDLQRWLLLKAVPMKKSGERVIWSGIIQDITDLKESEYILRRSYELLEVVRRISSVYFMKSGGADFFRFMLHEILHAGSCTYGIILRLGKSDGQLEAKILAASDVFSDGIVAAGFQEGVWSANLSRLPRLIAESCERKDTLYFESSSGNSREIFGQQIRNGMAIPLRMGERLEGVVFLANIIQEPDRFQSAFLQPLWSTCSVIFEAERLEERRKEYESDLLEAKIAADQANAAKSEFLAAMSHEIRTPLNAILGFTEVLREQPLDPEQLKTLGLIGGAGRTLLSLINDILDLSKIEAGKMDIFPEPTNIAAVLKEVTEIFSVKAAEKNLTLSHEFRVPDKCLFYIDETRLRQVLFNLIGNAIKFTRTGGVTVSLAADVDSRLEAGRLEIMVTDTGSGIPDENKEAIFNAFMQRRQYAGDREQGTGLGLTISRRLARLMGGEIDVIDNPGGGSVFRLRLPAIKIMRSQPEVVTDVGKGRSGNIVFFQPKVLIVDDFEDNRSLVVAMLRRHNVNCMEAESGQAALDLLKTERPDFIFMDLRMPGLDGYETTRLIRKDPRLSDIPVVALTASAMNSQGIDVVSLFDGYIRKPIVKNGLLEIMTRFLAFERQ